MSTYILIMNWQLCLICQKTSGEDLKCPLNVHGYKDKSAPYGLFLDRVNQFRELSSLPLPLDHLDKNITPDDLVVNRGCWHKSCYGKFSNDKIERARKRAASIVKFVVEKPEGLALLANCVTRMLVFL